jgi:ribosomal protein S18 acetylase RimI-like enzyme
MSDPSSVSVRPAQEDDAAEIAGLVASLAAELGDPTPITPAYVADYLRRPGCHALLAVGPPAVLGMLSYSLRPSLYHAADACLVEELIVQPAERNGGVGTLLLNEVLRLARDLGCAEVSLGVMSSNQAALRFYLRHGFEAQALLLERHLPVASS